MQPRKWGLHRISEKNILTGLWLTRRPCVYRQILFFPDNFPCTEGEREGAAPASHRIKCRAEPCLARRALREAHIFVPRSGTKITALVMLSKKPAAFPDSMKDGASAPSLCFYMYLRFPSGFPVTPPPSPAPPQPLPPAHRCRQRASPAAPAAGCTCGSRCRTPRTRSRCRYARP